MFHIVLHCPEIPPNTGNIIRLAANTGCTLHLIKPLGFELTDAHVRRAGLDYHDMARVFQYEGWDHLINAKISTGTWYAMTTKASRVHSEPRFLPGDVFVFGSETKGLPNELRESFAPSRRLRLPMQSGQRSLNLSNSVAVMVYEAWRQCAYALSNS